MDILALNTASLKIREAARDLKNQADERDESFTQKCDPRALQGGDFCPEAQRIREAVRELRRIAKELENF